MRIVVRSDATLASGSRIPLTVSSSRPVVGSSRNNTLGSTTRDTAMSMRRRMPPEIAAGIAEHASDDALSQREIEVLRQVARERGGWAA